MLRSLTAAVSGLRNHQTKLDAIGNNIANVNTVGYKSSQVRFQDIFSQTLRGATAPQAGQGGVNPMQVGLGMEVASINTLHTPGAITGTGRETDLAIEGNGYFVVTDGYQQYYTRDGTFTRDASGVLVNANGMRLLGWVVEDKIKNENEDDENGNEIKFSGKLSEIQIPLGEDTIAQATSNISFFGNLDAAAVKVIEKVEGNGETTKYIIETEECKYDTHVYDSLGNSHALTFTFKKAYTGSLGEPGSPPSVDLNKWTYTVSFTDGKELADTGNATGTICFTEDGRFTTEGSTINPFTITFPTEDNDDPDVKGIGAETLTITPDFSALTQLAMPSSVSLKEQDGFHPGELATFNIEATGRITGTYTNGMVRPLGQLALASFANPEGLIKGGSNLYEISANSGQPQLGLPGREGRGFVRSRSLEMSNVDLAEEFTEMITASRGFQANTRVITTSDEVLMELINIKR